MTPWVQAKINGVLCFIGKDAITPSPKEYHKGNKKDISYAAMDSPQSTTSVASISMQSFLTYDNTDSSSSSLGLSIPDLEASSASEMSAESAIQPTTVTPQSGAKITAPMKDITPSLAETKAETTPAAALSDLCREDDASLSPSSCDATTSPGGCKVKTPESKNDIILIPALATDDDKSTRSANDTACRMPKRTTSKKRTSTSSIQRRYVFSGVEEKSSRWEKPRQSKHKDKKDVAPTMGRRTVDTDDESDDDFEAMMGPNTSATQTRMPTSLRHMGQTQSRRYSEKKPKSESFLSDSRRQKSNNRRRIVPLESEEQPKRRKSGSLKELRCRRSSKTTRGNVGRTNSSSLRGAVRTNSSSLRGTVRTNSSSLRNSFRRSAGGLGSLLMPKRSSTSSAHGVRSGVSRSNSNHRRSSRMPTSAVTKDMNIFCSEMVSTDYILSQIQEAKENPEIVKLELEDLLERCTTDIALAIKDLLMCDDRPWEGVHFVDEVHTDCFSSYRPWLQRKNHFFRHLGNVCTLKLIPMTFATNLIIEDGNGTYTGDDDDDDDSIINVSVDDEDLIGLLREVQKDASVTMLKLSTSHSTFAIVKELITLLQCDDRKWESVQLILSGKAPFPKNSPHHQHWCQKMKASGQELQQVAKERGIRLNQ